MVLAFHVSHSAEPIVDGLSLAVLDGFPLCVIGSHDSSLYPSAAFTDPDSSPSQSAFLFP